MRKIMRKARLAIVLAALLGLGAFISPVHAQTNSSLDKSPLDMSYFPVDYPILKIQGKAPGPLVARVVYSRPQKKGRQLFGDLVPYGEVWRLGANEATEIEFFQDVRIDGKKIKKGRYTMYALVNPDKWSLILNKETDTWGAFKYDSTKDILRTAAPVKKETDISEAFSMEFTKIKGGASLVIHWDDVRVEMPISW
ncbi:MAG: DUF2911 domain-containing protein [Bacteroidota bacterium]|nr:DUF2911 domain-containing protein [Bacteroidota bacterium]MDP4218284.1 DUF2911 domain-containing protein [Bacteroidota bacterium]MDP4248313.1 DUF2911 domain-containing protein [Bacteroidota bacterium]MDP4253614.1 DUF2911 domain-containing protein [Bacteroidota bacterium]MDP4258284.1 DUF2911 domain-containing protein [Bacteroidota bacterium]